MVAARKWRPRLGDRVTVPWGLERVSGTIERLYGTPGDQRALVAVDLIGAGGVVLGSETSSFRLEVLEPLENEASA